MTEESSGKPFYLQPPWDILFNIQKMQRINPWNVDIAFLLLSFLEEMERRVSIDFRASGIALDSSASIYLMKSNLLLKLEEPPNVTSKLSIDFVPPPLILPLRYELTTTTIQNLLEALDETLKSEKILSLKVPPKPALPPLEITPIISAYLMEIEEEIKKLLYKIRFLIEKGEIPSFSKLVKGLEKIERVKIFIILLFMAQRGKVTLWQQEDFGEIHITLNGEKNGAND